MITVTLAKQGETLTFHSEADPAAPRAEGEITLAPGAWGPPPHIHTRQRETFHVVSGRMLAVVDGVEHTVEEGERLIVQAGQAHTFGNASEKGALVVRGAVEPALHFQWFLTEMANAANRGGGSWDDMPLLEAAYILFKVRREYQLAGTPAVIQSLLFGLLAGVAVLTGRSKRVSPFTESAARRTARS
jgi:mannose-6-phosphate isomerase-like protein (cupin superfamily)